MPQQPPQLHRSSVSSVPTRRGRSSADDVRQFVHERRTGAAVQLRKQRREERLQARRRTAPAAANNNSNSNATALLLTSAIASFAETNNPQHLVTIQQALQSTSWDAIGAIFRDYLQPQNQINAQKFVVQLLDLTAKAQTSSFQQQPSSVVNDEAILEIVWFLSTPAASPPTYADDYYSQTPLRWPDLLLSKQQQGSQSTPNGSSLLVEMLWSRLVAGVAIPTPTSGPGVSSTGERLVLVLSNILGNLVQDAAPVASLLLPKDDPAASAQRWQTLLQGLPDTSYLCAALVQRRPHLGMSNGAHLPSCLPSAPQWSRMWTADASSSVSVDAAWMLEGWTRYAGHLQSMVFNNEITADAANDRALVGSLLHNAVPTLCQHLLQTPTSQLPDFLFPVTRALGHLAYHISGAEDLAMLSFLLQVPESFHRETATFRPVDPSTTSTNLMTLLHTLLQDGRVLEILPTLGCFLHHPMALVPGQQPVLQRAWQLWCPSFVAILVHNQATLDWKREALWVLDLVLASAAATPPNGHSNLNLASQIIQEFLWDAPMPLNGGRPTGPSLLEALGSLLEVPDLSTSLTATRLVNGVLRAIPDARVLWEELDGVDRLENLCCGGPPSTSHDAEERADLAANLLDDFFDNGRDEENDDNMFDWNIAPPPATAFPLPSTDVAFGRGRGRGKPVPAWMAPSKSS